MLIFTAPASKSISHRMLMGAALAKGTSTVHNVLMSKDIERTCAVLSAAGAVFSPIGEQSFSVTGMAGRPQGSISKEERPLSCDMHESGTSCRLLTAILAAGVGKFHIHGAPRLHERPIGSLTKALTQLGVSVEFTKSPQCPPLIMDTNGFTQKVVSIDLDESSQYLSGLLLAAPCAEQGLTITLTGNKVVSWPYVCLTLQTLEDFGIYVITQEKCGTDWKTVPWKQIINVHPHNLRFCVPHAPYIAKEYHVEGDWSGASYFLAAGSVGKEPLCIKGLRQDSLQGDKAMLEILTSMGARFYWDNDSLILYPSPLHGITVDMRHCPDLVPTVAVLASFATGITTICNVAHLRIKESDRIAAPATELRKIGIHVEEREDGLSVHGIGQAPRIPQDTRFSAHGDHRIAMGLSLLSLHGQKVLLDDTSVVQKSFPHFWEMWEKIS